MNLKSATLTHLCFLYVVCVAGFLEFAGVVIWRKAFAFPTHKKVTVTSRIPLELTVYQVFLPTALMVSFILALLAAVLLSIEVSKASMTTGDYF